MLNAVGKIAIWCHSEHAVNHFVFQTNGTRMCHWACTVNEQSRHSIS
jgi:hypothetical protein